MKDVMTNNTENNNSTGGAPSISFKIPKGKIGVVIGSGGRIIKNIISQTNTRIKIEDDGSVAIFSSNQDAAEKAESWIKILAGNIEVGSQYEGIVKKIMDFGVFVELVPGKEGLVHISTIANEKQQDLQNHCKIGSKMNVIVASYDNETGRVRLKAPSLEN